MGTPSVSSESSPGVLVMLSASATCNGNPDSLWVRTAAEDICYYARADGALCEARGGTCRNLLAGGLKTIVLLQQPAGLGQCPSFVPAGAPWCFRMAPVPSLGPMTQVDLGLRDPR